MKIYLAASWLRRAEVQEVANDLAYSGLEICSSWLKEPLAPSRGREKFLEQNALIDLGDVRRCDQFVRFTDDLSGVSVPAKLATGGRMFEQGIAYAMGKPIYVVGGRQHLFDRLPNILHVKDAGELRRILSLEEIH